MENAVAASSRYGEGFNKLSPTVLYRIPPKTDKPSGQASTTSIEEPSLILFAAWMDAAPRHIAAYTTRYQRVFPTSSILVVTTASSHFLFQSNARRLRELEPALDILVHEEGRILLHAFSNGGATAAWLLARTIRQRSGKSLPVSKICFDSAPGTQDYNRSLAAFALALPKNRFLKFLGMLLLRIFLAMWFEYTYIRGTEKFLDILRKGLNDTQLFPNTATRLYIYSIADKLIKWQDVESHAKEAEGHGCKVQMCKYVDSGHVAHLLRDGKRYWSAVVGLWDSD